jgi:hypothetical protein
MAREMTIRVEPTKVGDHGQWPQGINPGRRTDIRVGYQQTFMEIIEGHKHPYIILNIFILVDK